jgi:hypothetical protein
VVWELPESTDIVSSVATTSIISPSSAPEARPDVPSQHAAGPAVIAAPKKSSQTAEQIAQTIVLVLLFASPALICVHGAIVADPDVWWHLRTGEWMLQHRALLRVDIFSATNAGKPYATYSWLFELLVTKWFQHGGLAGLVGYSASMVLAIAVASRHLIKRLQTDFTFVAFISFVACFSLSRLFTPRPWLFTILFFVLELDILMHARKTGKTRELLWLPVIFALWANIHIQFIDGLAVLGLALAEALGSRFNLWAGTRLRASAVWLALAGSVLGTLINPFGWHIYRVAYDLASQPGVLNMITELEALHFRVFGDFLVLFLSLAAAIALGWERRFRVFETGLFIFAAVVSFRSQRDIWVMAFVATLIIASTVRGRAEPPVRMPWFASTVAAVLAALAIFGSFHVWHVNDALLDKEMVENLPEKAVHEIQAKGYAGPLFNNFDWGGYLIWALRMPVSIDGRAAFYGDDAISRSNNTWTGAPDWASDPQLKAAGLVLGPAKAPLTQLLRTDPHYKLVYEDKLAAIFIARK